MKKLILPFAALLIGMAACQKEDTNVLTLEVEHYNGDAKMHIDNQDFAVWDDGDTVWLNGNPKRVTVDNTNHRATISYNNETSPLYASYPYITERSSFFPTCRISLPDTQIYRENSQGQQIVAAPMFAEGTDNNSTLSFRNIGSVLAVKVMNYTYDPLRVHSIQVTADNSQKLWGYKDLGLDGGTGLAYDPELSGLEGGGNTVTLKCGDGVEVPAEGKVFYIALPIISNTHLTIKVDDGYGIYTLAQTNNTATFGRNTLHQVPFSASEDICVDYGVRPQQDSNTIKYTATSKLTGFEENATAWGKTVVSHVYNPTSQRGTITFNSGITEVPDFAFYENSALLSIKLPESVETIGIEGFHECSNLYSVSMPGVTVVGSTAFGYCSALTTLDCPSISRIEEGAFHESGIQTITFGPNLSYLGLRIFVRCCNITDIYCKAQSVPECEKTTTYNPSSNPHTQITDHTFNGMMCTPTLHVPSGMLTDYDIHAVWGPAFRYHIVDDCPTD